jgi:Tol biopolymer transport system component/DNA-binding winged helix-turn-helix (wHTH) protein
VAEPATRSAVVRFGVFEVDLRAEELRKNGSKLKLAGQPFQVLAILLERPGEVVTRDELQKRLWPDVFVDVDHNLNTAINKIREVLGDSAESPRFVETLPRRGYRFIASSGRDGISKRRLRKLTPRASWTAIGATLLLLAGIGIWRFNRKAPEPRVLSGVVPFSSLPGVQAYPAFSNDGKQVAFIIEGDQNPGIYTALIGGEKPLRLTKNPRDSCPTWSPDGRQVAFSRYAEDGTSFSIYVMSAFGGSEHKLYTYPKSSGECLNWSPDGKVLAFSEGSRVALFSLSDSTTRPLTSPPDLASDKFPTFSPDGSTVAFVRDTGSGLSELFVIPATGGAANRLTFDNRSISGSPAWTPDSRDIVFSSPRRGLLSLWRISAFGGTPRPLGIIAMASYPSISREGNQLVYLHQVIHDNIWRVALRDEKHIQGSPTSLISAIWHNSRPHFSPDGKQVAFESDRSGYSEIWVCGEDGADCRQLTSLEGAAGAPRWSPDGRYIAFEFHPREHTEIYVVEMPDGPARLMPTFSDADNEGPSWSRDGQWIYFCSNRGGGHAQLWKIPFKGGLPVAVTRNGGVFAAESADGRFLYYSKSQVSGIWKSALQGGEETRIILDQPEGWDAYSWALVSDGIYFLKQAEGKRDIEFFEFATRKRIPISSLNLPASDGLDVSPDGRSIIFVQHDSYESNIMLVRGFQ